MLFYLVMGGLFTLYALDLLMLVIISAFARAAEMRAAMRVTRERKRAAKAKVEKEQAGLGDAVPKPETFAFGNAESMLKPSAASATTPSLEIKTQFPDAASDPQSTPRQSPVSTPAAPPCPEPRQRVANTRANSVELTHPTPARGPSPADSPLPTPTPCTPTATHATRQDAMVTSNYLYLTGVTTFQERLQALGAAGEADTAANTEVTPTRATSPMPSAAITPLVSAPTLACADAAVIEAGSNAPPVPEDLAHHPLADGVGFGSAPPGSGVSTPYHAPLQTQLSDSHSGSMSTSDLAVSITGQKPCQEANPPKKTLLTGTGGSDNSLCSTDSSLVSAAVVVKAELKQQPAQEGKRPLPRSYKDGVELPKRVEGAQYNYSDVVWPLPVEDYPLVLIQVPMYNEEAHAALIVERCCAIAWPRSRLLIQVLDDSTKAHIREKVDAAAVACMEAGHPVQVLRRTNRQGYKAGAMVEGLEHVAGLGFKYCAVFDADFEPPEDFLLEAVGPLEADGELGFVQTRWLNPYKSFLTWAQNINLGFHFDVEQRARSYMGWFFNFNGTAGVWRIQAISEAGGWETDTVVEDMDLSLRAYLAGWRGLYLPHVGCVNEVPDDLRTYKTQQYRWLCGPMQIFTKAFLTIWRAKKVPLRLRLNCYWFFTRYMLYATITLAVLVVPPVALWLDPWHWHWPEIFFCVSINFALAVYLYITPWSIAYMLFSVATGYFKAWAMLGGLLGSKKSKSWKVTAKKGFHDTADKSLWQRTKEAFSNIGAPYALEMCLFMYYAAVAVLAFLGVGLSDHIWGMGAYCSLMAVVFFIISFGDAFL